MAARCAHRLLGWTVAVVVVLLACHGCGPSADDVRGRIAERCVAVAAELRAVEISHVAFGGLAAHAPPAEALSGTLRAGLFWTLQSLEPELPPGLRERCRQRAATYLAASSPAGASSEALRWDFGRLLELIDADAGAYTRGVLESLRELFDGLSAERQSLVMEYTARLRDFPEAASLALRAAARGGEDAHAFLGRAMEWAMLCHNEASLAAARDMARRRGFEDLLQECAAGMMPYDEIERIVPVATLDDRWPRECPETFAVANGVVTIVQVEKFRRAFLGIPLPPLVDSFRLTCSLRVGCLPWDGWFRVSLMSEDPAALAAAEEPRIDGASERKEILTFTDDLSRTFCGVTFSAVMESPARAFAEQDFPERPEVFARARRPGGLFWTGSSKEVSALVWKHAAPLPSRYDPPAHTVWTTYTLGRPIRIHVSYWARLRELCIFVHGEGIAGPAALRALMSRSDPPAPRYLVLFLRPGLREYDRSEERPTLAYVAVSEITLSYLRPR